MSRLRSSGFTLVELLVMTPLAILATAAFVGAILALTGNALVLNSETKLLSDLQSALDRIEEDVERSGAFLATDNVVLVAPQGVDNDTTAFTNVDAAGRSVLLLNDFATTKHPRDPSGSLVYLANRSYACTSSYLGRNQVMTTNIVYWVKDGNTLFRRVLASNGYAAKACAGTTIWQVPSCAVEATGTMCQSQDEMLLQASEGVALVLSYFTTPNSPAPVAGATSGTDSARQSALNTATTVDVRIVAKGSAAGKSYVQTGSVRATRTGPLVTYGTP